MKKPTLNLEAQLAILINERNALLAEVAQLHKAKAKIKGVEQMRDAFNPKK
jgi:hypothetical protein